MNDSIMILRRSLLTARIFAMGLELRIRLPVSAADLGTVVGRDSERRRRIIAMKDSLVEMFGGAALSVARGQPAASDVAGKSGIRWCEVAEALRDA